MENTKQSKHTPGPWRVNERTGVALGMYGHNISASHYSSPGVTSGRDSICEVSGPHRDANARLIAAAPEMYEALLKCAEALRYHSGPADDANVSYSDHWDLPQDRDCYAAARAAIAKAEGGAS
jgi:hypothetical protein